MYISVIYTTKKGQNKLESSFISTSSYTTDNFDIVRTPLCPSNKMTPYYLENFDATTLWYDAIHSENILRLVCPKLRNFENEIKNGVFCINNKKVDRVKIERFRRTDIISMEIPAPITSLKFSSKHIKIKSGVSRRDDNLTKDKNCAIIMNKNNNLDWIKYFVQWHIKYHNLQCLVVLDNNSSIYTNKDIEQTLKQTGLSSLIILNLPFLFGPASLGKPYHNKELFLQSSAYNIAKFRFLKNARAVLCCDIDELVLPCKTTVFDETIMSRHGFLRFLGQYRFHNFESEENVCHKSSFYKNGEKNSPEKWCIDPKGKYADYSWSTHGLEKLLFERRFLTKQVSYIHCVNVTAGWKGKRKQPSDQLILDTKIKEFLDAV